MVSLAAKFLHGERDNAITLLASRLARSVEFEGSEMHRLTPAKVAFVLLAWRKEQLNNYKKWCVFTYCFFYWVCCSGACV